jgi:hypothetical protein
VGEHLGNGDLLFAVGAELRPVLGDRRVVVEQAVLGEHVHDGRGRPLAVDQLLNRVRASTGRPLAGSASPKQALTTSSPCR